MQAWVAKVEAEDLPVPPSEADEEGEDSYANKMNKSVDENPHVLAYYVKLAC